MLWSKQGVWQWFFEVLVAEAVNEYTQIDSTIVRAYQYSAGKKIDRAQECIGPSSGGLTTKIHATCDALSKSN